MTTTPTSGPEAPGPDAPARGGGEDAWGRGRSGLVLAALMLVVAVYLTVGIVTMEVPEGSESPGPTFYPIILAVVCYVLAAGLVVHYLRHRETPEDTDGVETLPGAEGDGDARFTDWRTLGLTMAGFLAFALLLDPLGWILSAALLFWVVAHAMGSRRPVPDLALALVMSCAVQVAFSAGLGLNLPAGVLEGVL